MTPLPLLQLDLIQNPPIRLIDLRQGQTPLIGSSICSQFMLAWTTQETPLILNRMLILKAIIAAAPQITAAQAADLEAGKAVAQSLCARCHSIGISGDSPFPPAPPLRLIPDRYNVEDLAEALAEGMVVGHDAMPQFELPLEKISPLLAYIGSLKRKK